MDRLAVYMGIYGQVYMDTLAVYIGIYGQAGGIYRYI